MGIIDSDKTHKAGMATTQKLSAPHTMLEDDRSSVSSLTSLISMIMRLVTWFRAVLREMPDVLAQADVVLATPVSVAEKNFREIFTPHYIISDEKPRDKESQPSSSLHTSLPNPICSLVITTSWLQSLLYVPTPQVQTAQIVQAGRR